MLKIGNPNIQNALDVIAGSSTFGAESPCQLVVSNRNCLSHVEQIAQATRYSSDKNMQRESLLLNQTILLLRTYTESLLRVRHTNRKIGIALAFFTPISSLGISHINEQLMKIVG